MFSLFFVFNCPIFFRKRRASTNRKFQPLTRVFLIFKKFSFGLIKTLLAIIDASFQTLNCIRVELHRALGSLVSHSFNCRVSPPRQFRAERAPQAQTEVVIQEFSLKGIMVRRVLWFSTVINND